MSTIQFAQTLTDLSNARAEADRRLSALRDAERVAREAREDFERARRAVQRHHKRHQRLVSKGA